MRWRWASVCHLLLLLIKIATATEEDGLSDSDSDPPAASTVAAIDNDPVAGEGAHNTSKPTNEIGCEVSLVFYFVNIKKA